MPIFAGYSKLQVLLVLGYFSIWLYTFSCVANPFTDPKRSGWIVIFQLPFLFMFSAKNNILGWLVGFGYQSLNYLHRYVGQLVILAANVHAIGYVYDYFSRGIVFARLQRASNIFGLTALGCFNIIFIFSTSFWRKKAYNVFAKIHILGFVTAVPAIYFHRPSTLPFIIAVCAVYYLNLVLRLAKTRIVTATIRPLSSFSATRIEIPRLNSGWHAGQHVRVRILSMQFGRLGWSESHPFTIASAPVAAGSAVGDETLTLICKKTGTWTAKLFELAKEGSDLESGGADIGKTIKIMIEGPYWWTRANHVFVVLGHSHSRRGKRCHICFIRCAVPGTRA
ncbi:hypothetical protein F5887DRAFT_31662 [Amanita rubescens]|nr:hypothetical protein F5887DRAFT_31662 [Amanita rubescens]